MKINRTVFLESLEKVMPAVGVNVLVPEYQCIKIDGKRIQATNGVMLIDCACAQDTGVTCGIPADPFISLLRSLRDDEIELECTDTCLRVRTNKLKGSFSVLKDVKFLETPHPEESRIIISSNQLSELIEGLVSCSPFVSKDETAGPVCGVYLTGDMLFSSDRYRIAMYTLDKEVLAYDCSFPVKLIELLARNKDTISEIYCSSNKEFTFLLKDGTCISSLLFVGEYPDLHQYSPDSSSSEFREIVLGEGTREILERHISFLKEVNSLDKEIEISVKGETGKCSISSVNSKFGQLTEEVDLAQPCSETTFLVDPLFLREVLDKKCSLKYFLEENIILIEKGSFQLLVQTRQ